MSKYNNSYFGISIDFPENWKLRYWGNTSDRANPSARIQIDYDDVPTDETLEKELFYSFKMVKGSPSITSCAVGMAVFYRKKEWDFSSERIPTANELKRDTGVVEVSGFDAKYLSLELQLQKTVSYRKFVYWEAKPKLWLNLAMEGDTLENFQESERLFSRL